MPPRVKSFLDSQTGAALVGILSIIGVIFALGDRLWVTRDKFDERMDRIQTELQEMRAEIRTHGMRDST